MRSDLVAFCLFAICVSSSSCASAFNRRDGGLSFPNAALEKVDNHSDDDYPTGGSSDQVPHKPNDKPTWTPPPPPAVKSPASTEASDYPAGGSEHDTKKDQPYVASPWPKDGGEKDVPDDQEDSYPTQGASYPNGGSNAENKKEPKPSTHPAADHTKTNPKEEPDSPVKGDGQVTPSPWTAPMDKNVSSPTGSAHKSTGDSNPSTMQCFEYAQANTTRASCDKNPAIVCTGGCTGARVAHDCQLNLTSPNTTQTCTIGFGRSSASSYVCVNADGVYSCTGTPTGQATCTGCVDASSVNETTSPDGSSSGAGPSSNQTSSDGSNPNAASSRFISPLNAIFSVAFTVMGAVVLL